MRRIVQLCCLALAAASAAAADIRSGPVVWPRVYIENERTAGVVRRALDGAASRLAGASCQTVFSDFLDEQGRPLQARLLELEQTGTGYLTFVVFLDGSEMPQCRNRSLVAYTGQGYRTVYVCGRRFERALLENRTRAEATIIHEALHTLGLGENPPSSLEITQQVMRRCRR